MESNLAKRAAAAKNAKNTSELLIIYNTAHSRPSSIGNLDLVNIGIALRDSGLSKESKSIFSLGIRKSPDYIPFRYELAIQHFREGSHLKALNMLKEVHKIAPSDIRTVLLLYRILTIAGGYCEANLILDSFDLRTNKISDEQLGLLSIEIAFNRYYQSTPPRLALESLRRLKMSRRYLDADRVYEMILMAIRDKQPFSLIRAGDGEGAFLRQSTSVELLNASLFQYCRNDRARVWIGENKLTSAHLDQLLMINDAIDSATICGIPYTSWLEHELRIGSICGIVSLSNLALHDYKEMQLLCDQRIHVDLYKGGYLHKLLNPSTDIGIISCHTNLRDIISKDFNIRDIEYYFTTGELGHSALLPKDSFGIPHFPGQFNDIIGSLSRPLNGKLFLVAAGILGKFYCKTIKDNGGIAIDIGSIADKLSGCNTRPGMQSLGIAQK